MKKVILFSAFVAGLTAMAAQIILIREFLIVFSGDELSIGLVLSSWLAGGAVGSLLLRNLAERIKLKIPALWLCQALLSLYLPLSIFLVRSIRVILAANTGEILPFYILMMSSLILLLPICATLGFIFPLLCRIYREDAGNASGGIAKVYALESLGSMLGGLIAGFLLVRLMNSFQAAAVLSLLNILSGLLLIHFFHRKRMAFYCVNLFLLIGVSFLFLTGSWRKLDNYSTQRQWKGYELLETKNTIYENLSVFKRGKGQVSFFGNGVRLYTIPDKQFSEEAVNFCLLEHKSPEDILLIGGGFAGLLADILKHPVKNVVYLELDSQLLSMAERFLPEQYCTSLKDKRVNIINVDARFFIKDSTRKYDCIILNVGEPYNALINRFYTYDFFNQLKQNLKAGGIFSFGVSASESYINPELTDYLRSLFLTLKSVFPEVKAIPGETIYFLASNTKDALTYDYNVLMQRAKERLLKLEYVREYYLSSRMSEDKINHLEGLLNKKSNVMINFDFRPSSYYYGIISWSSRFSNSLFTKLLKTLDMKIILSGFGLILFILFLFCLHRPGKSLLAALAIGGFAQSAFQIILIFSFQVLYGYLFYKLGFLFAFFMLGLFVSAWLYSRGIFSLQQALRRVFWVQAAVVLFSVFIPLFLYGISKINSVFVVKLGANVFFPALSLFAGLFGGYLFGAVNQIYSATFSKLGAAKVAGLTYGWDLVGACLGAALCAVFLIPIAGITVTCILIGVSNLLVLCLLVVLARTI